MKLPTLIAITAALLASTPAHAEWFSMIYESGDIRQAHLTGYDDGDSKKQVTILCTTAGADFNPNLAALFSLPATGKYAVRSGDSAKAVITIGDLSWDLEAIVQNNSSSGFLADADGIPAYEIVGALESDPVEVTATISTGPIEATYSINTDKLGDGPTEWLDGCGR